MAIHDSSPELSVLQQQLAFAEQLLTGVAAANNTLINAENYRESIQASLAILGQATEVDRVYIFECHSDADTGDKLMSQRWEWVAPGIVPEIDNPELQNLSFKDCLPSWYPKLSQNQDISGLIKDFSEAERAILEPQSIISIVVVPIAVRRVFWGFMGFDDCHRGHIWSQNEINALKTVANSFGGAFARQAAETALQQINESLEERIQERTAELEASTALANSANRAKSDFLANMSHELRTPLNGILGYAQILQRSNTVSPAEHDQISIIEQCGQHLLMLINDVLDLAKIESKRMELYPSDIQIEPFLDAVIETFRLQANNKNIELYYSISSDIPSGIRVDKKRLRQVLFNLVSNAIKFTETGAVEIRLTAAPAPQSKSELQQYQLYFEVRDTGIGISPADIHKIFTPFEQASSIEKRLEGTGLGLAISQKIVSMMGGKLELESSVGQGSQFFFKIICPAVSCENQTSIKPSKQRVKSYKGAIHKTLVIDDRWENRAVLANMLHSLGFQVIEAENGAQGLEQAIAEEPELIITDLFMPVMDGYEFMQLLRQQPKAKNTKVIVSSASVFQTDQQHSLDAGGDYFIAKPVQLNELIQTLQQALNLEWGYEEDVVQPAKAPVVSKSQQAQVAPSLEVLLSLQKLALSGLIQKFCQELDELDQRSSDYQAFTQEHRAWAADFKLHHIQQALKAAIAQAHSRNT